LIFINLTYGAVRIVPKAPTVTNLVPEEDTPSSPAPVSDI
jgi:hypothetical protein